MSLISCHEPAGRPKIQLRQRKVKTVERILKRFCFCTLQGATVSKYSRASVAQTLMAHLPCLGRTVSWVPRSHCI